MTKISHILLILMFAITILPAKAQKVKIWYTGRIQSPPGTRMVRSYPELILLIIFMLVFLRIIGLFQPFILALVWNIFKMDIK